MSENDLYLGEKNITLTPNSFQTPNDVVDVLMGLLTAPEFKVYMAAVRQILGWRDKITDRRDNISLSQFQSLTGQARSVVNDALKGLQQFGLLAMIEKNTQKGTLWELCEARYIDLEGLGVRNEKRTRNNRKRTEKAREAERSVRQTNGGSANRPPGGSANRHTKSMQVNSLQTHEEIGIQAKQHFSLGPFRDKALDDDYIQAIESQRYGRDQDG